MSFRPVKPRAYGSTKALVAELIDAAGGAKDAAFLIERGLSQTYGYADEAVPDAQISLDAARRLAAGANKGAGSPALAQLCAADVGGVFTPAPASDEEVNALLAKGESAHGRFLAEFLRGLDREDPADVTPETLRQLDDCVMTLAALRRRLAP